MRLIRNPEIRGIAALVLVILVIAAALIVVTGKLEAWFGISLGGGPKLLGKIVYVSGKGESGDLYAMDPDGSHRQRLTEGAGVMSAPAVASTGQRIVFVAMYQGSTQVFSVGGGGGRPDMLTVATGHKLDPGFSPNGRRLSFISSGAVYAAEPGGANLDKVLPTPTQTRLSVMKRGSMPAYTQYAWAPDSERMAAVMKGDNDSDVLVYLAGADDAREFAVSDQPQTKINGLAWSPEGDSLAVAVNQPKKSFIGLYDFENKRSGILAAAPKQQLSDPRYSPDGAKVICVVSALDEKTPGGILEIDVQTGHGRLLAKGEFARPSYSPDGSRILATHVGPGDKRNIAILDPEAGEISELTTDGRSYDGVWSPAKGK